MRILHWIGNPAQGGTTYTVTCSGSITPTGTLVKQANTHYAGTITPVGTLAKQANKTLAGTVTPTSTLVKLAKKILVGVITPVGTLTGVPPILPAAPEAPTQTPGGSTYWRQGPLYDHGAVLADEDEEIMLMLGSAL